MKKVSDVKKYLQVGRECENGNIVRSIPTKGEIMKNHFDKLLNSKKQYK